MKSEQILDELYAMLERTEDDDTIAEIYEAIKYNERKVENEKLSE